MNNKKCGLSIKWMILGCVVLFLFFFFARNKLSTGILWPILIGVCVLGHIWMMTRWHGSHTTHNANVHSIDEKKENVDLTSHNEHEKDGDHHSGCCKS